MSARVSPSDFSVAYNISISRTCGFALGYSETYFYDVHVIGHFNGLSEI